MLNELSFDLSTLRTGYLAGTFTPAQVIAEARRRAGGGRPVWISMAEGAEVPASELLRHVEPEDLLSFGMIPEFIGRLPVAAALDPLTEDELMLILTDTKNALIKQYQKLLAIEGVNLNVTKDALRALAEQAAKKGTGARALRSMLERIMLEVMYDIPSRDDVAEVTINRGVVEGKRQPTLRRKQDKDAA